MKNCYYIDDHTGLIKIGTHSYFDEAHMTTRANRAPIAAEALQRLGYNAREHWITDDIIQTSETTISNKIQVQQLTTTSTVMSRASDGSVGYDLFSDSADNIIILPGAIATVPTGLAAAAPLGTYLRIAPRSGLTVKNHLHTLAGVIDPDFRGNITVVLQNFGTTIQTIKHGDKMAQLIIERAQTPDISVVTSLTTTSRGAHGFGSTDTIAATNKNESTPSPNGIINPSDSTDTTATSNKNEIEQISHPGYIKATTTAPFPTDQESDTPNKNEGYPSPPFFALHNQPSAAAAATLKIQSVQLAKDLHFAFDMPYDIHLSNDMFDNHATRTIETWGTNKCLGLSIYNCSTHNIPRLEECLRGTPAARIPKWRSQLRHSFITAVNNIPIKTKEDIQSLISKAQTADEKEITITFATTQKHAMHPQQGLPQLYRDQLNIVGQHMWELRHDPEWNARTEGALPILQAVWDPDSNIPSTKALKISKLITKGMKLSSLKKQRKLTRTKLMKMDDWSLWKASEWKQLDAYSDQKTFDAPESLPKGSNLLSLIWTYLVKDDGRRKARCVCNGSKNMRGSVTMAETYTSALEQTGAQIFWSACALQNYIIIGADAANAFAEAPPPKAPLYVRVDKQYREWYLQKFGKIIPEGHVLRVRKALQGHPKSPRLWATLIDKIIRSYNLTPCTHEPNLYYTNNYNSTGKGMLFLCQVDDFAIGVEDRSTANDIISKINSEMSIEISELGQISRYNGVDIQQTRHYIKAYNCTYIDKLCAHHDWIKRDTPAGEFPVPMKADPDYQRRLETSEPLTPDMLAKVEKKFGFTYRQAVGEQLYALVTCRPDISFAVTKLSQYSTRPSRTHFEAVKDVYRYLYATRNEGIYYWRKSP